MHDEHCEHQHPDPAVRANAREHRGVFCTGCECERRAAEAARKRSVALYWEWIDEQNDARFWAAQEDDR